MIARYVQSVSKEIPKRFDIFWFEPSSPRLLQRIRIAVCAVAALWFASFIPTVQVSFGDNGWLAPEITSRIAASSFSAWERMFLISPLWWSSSPTLMYGYLFIGMALSVVSAFGRGGRATLAVLFMWIILLTHRLPALGGALEPLLSASVAYLFIAPGRSRFRHELTDPSKHTLGDGNVGEELYWAATVSIRFFQVHSWLLLLFALLMQCAGLVWWRGEAVWWLAETGHSTLLRPEMLVAQPLLVNLLTHATTLVELVAVLTLWPRWLRPIGVLFGLLAAAAIALLADQLLYGALLAGCLLSFLNQPWDAYCPRTEAAETAA